MKSAYVNIQLVYQDRVVSAATGFRGAYDIARHTYDATVETLKRHLTRTQRRIWRQARKPFVVQAKRVSTGRRG